MEKGKTSSLYFFIFFVFILYTFYNYGMAAEKENLLSAYQNTGATIEKIRIYSYSQIHDPYFSFERALQVSEEIKRKLDVPELMITEKKAEREGEKMEVSWKGKNTSGHPVFLKIHSSGEKSKFRSIPETYISIEVEMIDGWPELGETEQKIKSAMSRYRWGHTNRCVIGSFEGKLTEEEKNQALQGLLEGFQGKEVEVFQDEHLLSVTGWSRKINEWVAYDGKKVNFQISFRYHSADEKTYLLLGTPLIEISY
ncbi:MAG TPA: hypothetical protein GX503_03020 [Clostridiales bacterium]|nr:hypothetical protein [Clostridiales bacterium]